MPVVVSDFTALLSGFSWSAGVPGRAAFVTYSFDTTYDPYLKGAYPQAFLDSFQGFSAADQALTRQILDAYAASSGLTLFEVAAGQGDIRLGKYDLTLAPGTLSAAVGFAQYPAVTIGAFGVNDTGQIGDVFINAASINPVLLSHELAHAFGLKHPYDGDILLDKSLQVPAQTIFAGGVPGGANIGPAAMDIQALQYLYGGPGNDGTQVASWSWDAVNYRLTQIGGSGADTILGVGVSDVMAGNDGDDVLAGGDGADSLSGGAGADRLFGSLGADTLDGGDGDDTLQGEGGANVLRGGAGNDSLGAADDSSIVDGGDGVDRLVLGGFSTSPQKLDFAALVAAGHLIGVEQVTITGGAAGDTITGSAMSEVINGNGGADVIRAGAGDDAIGVTRGASPVVLVVDGGDGNDSLSVFLTGSAAAGGAFNAGELSSGGSAISNIEHLSYVGSPGADTIVGGDAGEGLFGLGGDDLIAPGGGADNIAGGDGNDTVDFSGETARIDLTINATRTISAGVFEFMSGIENVIGAAFNDAIRGDAGDNQIFGRPGDDTISGGAGTNYLRGDEGDDSIVGGEGFDDINGNAGNDTCVSGGGDDWVVGGKDNDSLVGSDGQNLVYGNLGNDTCDGGGGNDIVRGGQGDDVVMGGAGDDFVSGDKGDDTVTGGAGADIFHSFSGAGIDRVTDFHVAEGDRVLLDPGTTFTLRQAGGDTIVDMGGGDQLILVGISMSALPPGVIVGG
jgi:Ca2+-binding RTX toxin-like protein